MQPRPYQQKAMEAVHAHLCEKATNPAVVLPTGSGKTPAMAWMIQNYMRDYPYIRVLVLAHIQELLQQGVNKMKEIWPLAPVGVYSAGLKGKDRHEPITYAGIQSIWRHASKFQAWDLIFVDEAHRIPLSGETTYRHFLRQAKEMNPNLRIVGWTATPFRMNGGPICSPTGILNEICYEANVRDLIQDGYLCPLKSKGVAASTETSKVHIRNGEFVTSELMSAVNGIVKPAVTEAVNRIADRKSIIFFCVTVEHAEQVSSELREHGLQAPVIHAKTPKPERADIIRQFTSGALRAVVNCNVLAEGFDAQRIDCVVLMRPTASAGLFYQQVGRGLRTHPEKSCCLVLDFAGNTLRHGPIDTIRPHSRKTSDGGGESPAKECPGCQELIHAGLQECPECGFQFPKREIKHDTKPSEAPLISEDRVWEVEVQDVLCKVHEKAGKPPSLQVTYYGQAENHREWICFEHGSFAGQKAKQWWRRRFPGEDVPKTTADAINRMFLSQQLRAATKSIQVKRAGKYTEILNVRLRDDATAIAH